jgi:hypothetical protein
MARWRRRRPEDMEYEENYCVAAKGKAFVEEQLARKHAGLSSIPSDDECRNGHV